MKTEAIVKESKYKLKDKVHPVVWVKKEYAWGKTQRRLWPVFAAAGLLLVLVIFYGFYKVVWPQKNLSSTRHDLTTAASAVANKKDYNTAIATSLAARRDAATKEGRFDATMSAAGWYLEKKDYKNALFYYQDAEKLMTSTDVNVYLGVANAAQGANNKTVAKTYYQKAIDFYKKDQGSGTKNKDIITFLQGKASSL